MVVDGAGSVEGWSDHAFSNVKISSLIQEPDSLGSQSLEYRMCQSSYKANAKKALDKNMKEYRFEQCRRKCTVLWKSSFPFPSFLVFVYLWMQFLNDYFTYCKKKKKKSLCVEVIAQPVLNYEVNVITQICGELAWLLPDRNCLTKRSRLKVTHQATRNSRTDEKQSNEHHIVRKVLQSHF